MDDRTVLTDLKSKRLPQDCYHVECRGIKSQLGQLFLKSTNWYKLCVREFVNFSTTEGLIICAGAVFT